MINVTSNPNLATPTPSPSLCVCVCYVAHICILREPFIQVHAASERRLRSHKERSTPPERACSCLSFRRGAGNRQVGGGARWREKCKWEQEKKRRHQWSEAVLFFSLTPPQSSTLNLFINIQHHIKRAIQIITGIHAKVKNWQCLFQTPAPKVSLLLWPKVFMFIKLKEKIIATARCSLAELI